MKATTLFRFVLLSALVAGLFWLSGCQPPCRVPNPLLKLDLPGSGFSVTFDSVATATAVALVVLDAEGDTLLSVSKAPGETQIIDVPMTSQNKRPLQLRFVYKSASGDTVAQDSLRVDDTQDVGVIPDMDIEMGVTSQCPSATHLINPETDGDWRVFPWSPTDTFVVQMRKTSDGTLHKICLIPASNPNESLPGTVNAFRMTSGSCLTDPAFTQMEENKQLRVTVSTTAFDIRALDDNTEEDRLIRIKVPTGCILSVTSNHEEE